nr:reverse transcriptase domain-containing protein [Tanacetum cinerariifolium]
MPIETTFKSMCRKQLQQVTIKETPVSDLRWLLIKFDPPPPVFLPIRIIKTILIGETILIKTEVEISTSPISTILLLIKANFIDLRNMQSQGQSTQNQCQNIQNQNQNLQIQMVALTEMMSKFVSSNTASSSGSGTLPGPKTLSPSKQGTKVTKDQVQTLSSQDTALVQPSVIQSESQVLVFEPVVALMPNLKPSIPYPSRRDNEKHRDQANEQIEKFYEIFKDMSFEISFMDALTLMPKFASTLKALIGNKEKLNEMARTLMNKHYLGASINLIPFSVWEALSLLELTSTCMTLELANRSVSKPIGIAKHVSFKVGVLQFPVDFEVIDFEPNPRVPLILGRCFLKIGRALIDVHKGVLTIRIKKEAITYNLDQTVRYSVNYDQMTANKIDVICEIYSQEVLGFFDVTASGSLTPDDDPIISTTSPTLTPFGDNDFLLFEEADAFLTILNSEPLPPLPNHEQYLPSYRKELKVCEAKTVKSFVDEPPEVELKDLPPHLEYAFLEGDNKLPVIIAKELGDEEKSALIKGGFTVVENEENELISTRLVTRWRVCIDYHKLNEATRKDHFPLPFMDQMLERLAGNEYYCFLDGFSGITRIVKSLSFSFIRVSHPQLHFGNPVEAKALSTNDARVVCKFLKSLFARFGSPRAIISDRETYFCNDQVTKVMLKYGVTHRLSTVYHPQTSGQVEVSNRGLKRILKRTIGKLKTHWSGPFTIAKVFPYGTVELSQDNGPNFKVNGHRVKHYFRGDIPQLVVPDL